MLGPGRYLLGVIEILLLGGFAWLGGAAVRAWLLPRFEGAPAHLTTAVIALALLICALLVFGTLGIWRFGLPGWFFRVGTGGVAAVFLLRAIGDFRYLGFFKTVRDTTFARNDSWLYSPLCALIASSCAILGTVG